MTHGDGERTVLVIVTNAGCFKKCLTTFRAYINSFRGHAQCFELSSCSKTHRDLPGIVMVQCDFHWYCRVFQKELYNFGSLYKFIQRACTVF
jgi:hypothetical protein